MIEEFSKEDGEQMTVTTIKGRTLTVSKAATRRLEQVRNELQEAVDEVALYWKDPVRCMEMAALPHEEREKAIAGLTEEEQVMIRRLGDVLRLDAELEWRWEKAAS